MACNDLTDMVEQLSRDLSHTRAMHTQTLKVRISLEWISSSFFDSVYPPFFFTCLLSFSRRFFRLLLCIPARLFPVFLSSLSRVFVFTSPCLTLFISSLPHYLRNPPRIHPNFLLLSFYPTYLDFNPPSVSFRAFLHSLTPKNVEVESSRERTEREAELTALRADNTTLRRQLEEMESVLNLRRKEDNHAFFWKRRRESGFGKKGITQKTREGGQGERGDRSKGEQRARIADMLEENTGGEEFETERELQSVTTGVVRGILKRERERREKGSTVEEENDGKVMASYQPGSTRAYQRPSLDDMLRRWAILDS